MRLLVRSAILTAAVLLAFAAPAAAERLAGLSGPTALPLPAGFAAGAVAADGAGRLYVLSEDGTRVAVATLQGALAGEWPTGLEPQSPRSTRLAASRTGDVYLMTWADDQVRRYRSDGALVETLGDPGDGGEVALEEVKELAVTPAGDVLVGGNFTYRLAPDGRLLGVRAEVPPRGLAVGPDGVEWSMPMFGRPDLAYLFGVVGRTPEGRFVALKPFEPTFAAPGGINPGSVLTVTPGNELVTYQRGRFEIFGAGRQSRLSCSKGASSFDPAGIAAGADGSLAVSEERAVSLYRPSPEPGICTPAPFRVSRFQVRAARGGVRVIARITARPGQTDQAGYRLGLQVVGERRDTCAGGQACVGVEYFTVERLGTVRAGRTARFTVRGVRPGRSRLFLTAQGRGVSARTTTGAVPYTVRRSG